MLCNVITLILQYIRSFSSIDVFKKNFILITILTSRMKDVENYAALDFFDLGFLYLVLPFLSLTLISFSSPIHPNPFASLSFRSRARWSLEWPEKTLQLKRFLIQASSSDFHWKGTVKPMTDRSRKLREEILIEIVIRCKAIYTEGIRCQEEGVSH